MTLDLHAKTKLINEIFISIIYIYEDADTILFHRGILSVNLSLTIFMFGYSLFV